MQHHPTFTKHHGGAVGKESAHRLTLSFPSITPAPQEEPDVNGLETSLTRNTSPSLGDDSITLFFDVIGEEEQQNENNNNNPCKIPNIDAKTQNPKIKAVTLARNSVNNGEAQN